MVQKNKIVSKTNQIKAIWYNWDQGIRDSTNMLDLIPTSLSNNLNRSTSYDISNHIIDFSYNKTMSNGAGSFNMTLGNSHDWAKDLKAGTWFLVFVSPKGDLPLPKESGAAEKSTAKSIAQKAMSGSLDPSVLGFGIAANIQIGHTISKLALPPAPENVKDLLPYIRAICFVQRVAISSVVGPDGQMDITYKVSGKDFGVCLDENELWFNVISNTERSDFENIATSKLSLPAGDRRLNILLNTWLDAFLKPEKYIGSMKGRKQWILPDKMLKDLGIDVSAKYMSDVPNLRQLSNTTFENKQPNPLHGLQGNAWERLKQLAQPEFHELFTELNDNGLPRIYFRPIPWGIDQSNYPTLAQTIDTYISLTKNEPSALSRVSSIADKVNAFTGGNISSLVAGAMDSILNPPEPRFSRLDLNSEEVLNVDIGPDFHSHYNHFIVEPDTGSKDLKVALSILSELSGSFRPFPFENTESIQRHGFRPRHISVAAFKTELSGFGKLGELAADLAGFGDKFESSKGAANADFLRQINEVQVDYWGRQKHFYSGTFTIGGRSDLRLGKVFVTESEIPAIGNMVFYIEGYTDTISVDENGTVDWIQTVMVTRGAELQDLETLSKFGEKQLLKTLGTFIT